MANEREREREYVSNYLALLDGLSCEVSEVAATLVAHAYLSQQLWRDGHVHESVANQHETKAQAMALLAAVMRESRQQTHLHEQLQQLVGKVLKYQQDRRERKNASKTPT